MNNNSKPQNKLLSSSVLGLRPTPMLNTQILVWSGLQPTDRCGAYYNNNEKKLILKKDNTRLIFDGAAANNNSQTQINKVMTDKLNLEKKLVNLTTMNNNIKLNSNVVNGYKETLLNNSEVTKTQLILNIKNSNLSNLNSKLENQNLATGTQLQPTPAGWVINNTQSSNSIQSQLAGKGKKYYGLVDLLTPVSVKSKNVLNNSKVNLKQNINLSLDIKVSQLLRSFYKLDSDVTTSQSIVYNFTNQPNKKIVKNLTSILNNAFYSMSSVISKPVLHITPNKIVIHLFYYLTKNYNKNVFFRLSKSSYYKNLSFYKKILFKKFVFKKYLAYNQNKFQLLCVKLSKFLRKPVELELVRLHYRYNETHILAKTLGLLGDKFRRPFRYFAYRTFAHLGILNNNKSKVNPINPIIPTFITGISVKLAGRLSSQKTIPRKTVKRIQRGTIIRTNAQIITSSRFTKKNRKGIFSVTVSMGQRFF